MYKQILFFYGIVLILGCLVGAIGSGFQFFITLLSNGLTTVYHVANLHDLPVGFIAAIVSMLLVFVTWMIVRRFAPEAAGSGVPEIEGALLHERPIHWAHLLPVKFIGGILSISANMVLGREGPTIQIGGNLGAMLSARFRIPKHRRETLILAGAAAGLATAFNAPLAGVLFVIEEMRHAFNYSFTNFSMVAICCVSATIIQHLMIGSQPAILMSVFETPSLHSLVWFFLFGIVVGFAGLLFNLALMRSLGQTDRFSLKQRIVFVLMVGALIGYLGYVYPDVVGGGYQIIEQSLSMRPSFTLLLILIVVRFFTTMLCYTTGVPGGIFAPMLALGTLLGLACSYILQWSVDPSLHPGMFAVAGMGALFAAAVRAPLTGIVLVVEMTQNYSLILPLMVTCLTSTTVVQLWGNQPIYTQLLFRLMKHPLPRKLNRDRQGVDGR